MRDSGGEGEDDDLVSFELGQSDFDQLDAIEARPSRNDKPAGRPTAQQAEAARGGNGDGGIDDDDLLLSDGSEWDDLDMVNQLIEAESRHARGEREPTAPAQALQRAPPAPVHRQPVAGPSRPKKHARSPSSGGQKRQLQQSSSSGPSGRSPGGGGRQLNLFGEVLPVQSSQGVLLVANRANTATATASQKVRDALTKQNHRFHLEAKGKRKEWDRSQPLVARKSGSENRFGDGYDDEGESELWGEEELMGTFTKAPSPRMPDVLKQMKVQVDRKEAESWIYPTNKEKRDYQYNIVQRALFNNVLVALPTGLGKTFIAAVVILNYYRWFPTGKIIFVAPTKPLVAQQQQACHGICGLPWDCAVEMTGGTKASLRGDEWKTKRIFYMTPQTFENDLCSTAVDAEDVVCVVVDEAHRATGNYAYGKVIRWITARNPFFRVLALTATPGNKPDKVQEVIDNLHINLIEIRTEEAVDIRKYVHTKTEDPVVVPLGGVVAEIKSLFSKVMKPILETLNQHGLLSIRDPCSLSPFAVTQINKDPSKRAIISQRKLYPQVSDLSAMARAMEYLIRYSVQMFFERLTEMQSGTSAQGRKAVTNRQKDKFQNNTVVREIEKLYLQAQDFDGKVRHPKMEYLQNVVTAHFTNEGELGSAKDTRVMVFCQFRECVLEIVDILNELGDIKAASFVGQSSDSKGNKGMRQKDQEKIVQDFKSGVYNVLVATSIGEEGLDIGEVDLIVCYEAVKNSVRMLQRVGRTGRKRKGRIVVLMSEGPEENFWQQSKDNHRTIQDELINGSHLELFDDVERLIPEDITCTAVAQDVDQPPFEPSMIRAPNARREKKVGKARRNADPGRNIPSNGIRGFVKVSEMKRKKTRVSNREGDSSASQSSMASEGEEKESAAQVVATLTDDSADEQLERGLVLKRRGQNEVGAESNARASAPIAPSSTPPNGTVRRRTGCLGTRRAAVMPARDSSVSRGSASSRITVQLLSSSPPEEVKAGRQTMVSTSPAHLQTRGANVTGSQDGEDDEQDEDPTPSSSMPPRRARPHSLMVKLAADLSEDDGLDDDGGKEQGDGQEEGKDEEGSADDGVAMLDAASDQEDDSQGVTKAWLESPIISHRKRIARTSRKRAPRIASSSPAASSMAPPPLPATKKSSDKAKTRGGKAKASEAKRRRVIGGSPTGKSWFQCEADRSTDEEVHGERDENDDGEDTDEADSSDREHVGDFAPTQAPRGYRQSAVYLQSLHSQAAPSPFRQRVRGNLRGFQMGLDSSQVQQVVQQQDTPRRSSQQEYGDEEYEKDSFVCSDEDVVFDTTDAESSQL